MPEGVVPVGAVPEGVAPAGPVPEGNLDDAERQRLTALYRYGLLGRDLDDALEDLVRLATLVCELPMGAVNLIDVDHQRQVATHGTEAADAPREESYCDITIGEDRPVVVSDTLLDPRFAGRAFTTGVLGKLRSYAGAQLTTPDGHHLGALCVFDEQPTEVTPVQVEALELLANQAMALFEAHRRADRLIDAEQRFRLAFVNTALGMALDGLHGRFLQVNEALAGLLGRDTQAIEGMTIAELTDPDDREDEAELMAEVWWASAPATASRSATSTVTATRCGSRCGVHWSAMPPTSRPTSSRSSRTSRSESRSSSGWCIRRPMTRSPGCPTGRCWQTVWSRRSRRRVGVDASWCSASTSMGSRPSTTPMGTRPVIRC